MLRLGDCLPVMGELPRESVDLVYIDPPFNSGGVRKGRGELQFDDRFSSIGGYREFLGPRLAEIYRVLKPTGSVLVHVDWRTSHHVRMMLDEIFGPEQFVNHIIWSYGLGGSGPRSFARKHDDILFYGRTSAYWFRPPMVPARSARLKGKLKKSTDVLEVPSINNMAMERSGYPTQKPLQLLDILVRACCPSSGLVLDPTCGSGTTLVAAVRAGRQALGIDQSPDALAIATKRLDAISAVSQGTTPTRRDAQVEQANPPVGSRLARSA